MKHIFLVTLLAAPAVLCADPVQLTLLQDALLNLVLALPGAPGSPKGGGGPSDQGPGPKKPGDDKPGGGKKETIREKALREERERKEERKRQEEEQRRQQQQQPEKPSQSSSSASGETPGGDIPQAPGGPGSDVPMAPGGDGGFDAPPIDLGDLYVGGGKLDIPSGGESSLSAADAKAAHMKLLMAKVEARKKIVDEQMAKLEAGKQKPSETEAFELGKKVLENEIPKLIYNFMRDFGAITQEQILKGGATDIFGALDTLLREKIGTYENIEGSPDRLEYFKNLLRRALPPILIETMQTKESKVFPGSARRGPPYLSFEDLKAFILSAPTKEETEEARKTREKALKEAKELAERKQREAQPAQPKEGLAGPKKPASPKQEPKKLTPEEKAKAEEEQKKKTQLTTDKRNITFRLNGLERDNRNKTAYSATEKETLGKELTNIETQIAQFETAGGQVDKRWKDQIAALREKIK